MKEAMKPRSDLSSRKEITNAEHPGQPIGIEFNLPPPIRQKLIDLLNKYKYFFTWTPIYMVGVDREVIKHNVTGQFDHHVLLSVTSTKSGYYTSLRCIND